MKLPAPRRSSVGMAALFISGLAVTQALGSVLPTAGQPAEYGRGLDRPFERPLTTTASADLLWGRVQLTSVRSGPRVEVRDTAAQAAEGATFVVASFVWTPSTQAQSVGQAWVDDAAGRRHEVGYPSREGVFCSRTQPGLAARCAAVVEVPLDAVAGARLSISPAAGALEYGDVAVVDLDEAQVASRAAEAQPIRLELGYVGMPS